MEMPLPYMVPRPAGATCGEALMHTVGCYANWAATGRGPEELCTYLGIVDASDLNPPRYRMQTEHLVAVNLLVELCNRRIRELSTESDQDWIDVIEACQDICVAGYELCSVAGLHKLPLPRAYRRAVRTWQPPWPPMPRRLSRAPCSPGGTSRSSACLLRMSLSLLLSPLSPTLVISTTEVSSLAALRNAQAVCCISWTAHGEMGGAWLHATSS